MIVTELEIIIWCMLWTVLQTLGDGIEYQCYLYMSDIKSDQGDMGVNSILELMDNSNSEIGIAYLKKMEFKLINLELKFATKNYKTHKLIYQLFF